MIAGMEPNQPVSIPRAVADLPGPWKPRELATVNEAVIRVARLEGEYEWHEHRHEELFLCWDGQFRLDIDGRGPVELAPGDLLVVPARTRHRPVAQMTAHAVLVEHPDTRPRGD